MKTKTKKIVLLIDFTSQLAKYKTIEARNKAFEKLSDEDKRLEIAWDALMLVVSQKVQGARGMYWSGHLVSVDGDSKHLQQVFNSHWFFKQTYFPCQVCARGVMMLSQIRLGNSIDSDDRDRMCGNYKNINGFSLDSMEKMEVEYEFSRYSHPYDSKTTEKLANICCNVLINGDFNEQDNTRYIKIVRK